MSQLCGIFNKTGKVLPRQMQVIFESLNKPKSSEFWLVSKGKIMRNQLPKTELGNHLLYQTFFNDGQQSHSPGLDCNRNLAVLYDGFLYNTQSLLSLLSKSHVFRTMSPAEVIAHLIEEKYKGNLAATLKQVAPMIDGDYSLAITDGKSLILMRDSVGLRPAFFAYNHNLMAFSSRKKVLWKLGLHNVKALRAGRLVLLDKDGASIHDVCSLKEPKIENRNDNLNTIVHRYCDLIRESVTKRMLGLKKVGVLISGGVDSCLIGKLATDIASDREIEITAYTAGTPGANDIEYARNFTQFLGIKHKVREMSHEDIKSFIPRVINAVEERDMVQVEAGVGIFAALEMASQDGISSVFSGQGPDELWGGYSWYPQLAAKEGYQCLQKHMWNDLARSDIETLDRENKIAIANGLGQVFPYCDYEVVKLAMSVAPTLKVKSGSDNMGKHPHRKAAEILGVPGDFAYRGKNAAQHSTGVHDMLDSIAQENGFTPAIVKQIGYKAELVGAEKLASSTRYGYLYDDPTLWQDPGHVQFYLDYLAYQHNLLNRDERLVIRGFIEKAGIGC
jgi:asparagine synthase (glutamine-hydrolysing)